MGAARGFASDNAASVLPEVMQAMQDANVGHAKAYGADAWTARAQDVFKKHLGPKANAFLVFNGTGANVTGLSALLRPYEAVVCTSTAHIQVDECGAPERFTGSKLITVQSVDGKLRASDVAPLLGVLGTEHHAQPKVASISQTTELGTVYTPEEVRSLATFLHGKGMLLHMDGARVCNAAAALGVPLREFTTDAGVDVLSFGGTKNGLMLGEAVVFLGDGLGADFKFIRKQATQLASKQRFLAAQFLALLEGDLWLRAASHANAMAALLASLVKDVKGVTLAQPVQANAIFARLPAKAIPVLQEQFYFYTWDEAASEVRWMCSHDTTEQDVREFAAAIAQVVPKFLHG